MVEDACPILNGMDGGRGARGVSGNTLRRGGSGGAGGIEGQGVTSGGYMRRYCFVAVHHELNGFIKGVDITGPATPVHIVIWLCFYKSVLTCKIGIHAWRRRYFRRAATFNYIHR